MLVPFEKLKSEFKRVLLQHDFSENNADLCAKIFAESSRDGVHTHGLNRFPLFVEYVKDGLVDINSEPTKEGGLGAIEQWNGNRGPGILNAHFCMNRAMQLANENGIGCVALKNTNHWMRGGTYGWQAADVGYIGICFTNTIANMPPWGGVDPRLGNNPLVIAVPRTSGHVVLDMSMSQYAFGKLQLYKARNEELPLPGGYDAQGKLSTNAAAIIESKRALPAGFWKGSGLSLMLDLLATVLSGGSSTAKVTANGKDLGASQVFICIKPVNGGQSDGLIDEIINYTKSGRPVSSEQPILYPGENTLKIRGKSIKEGVWVDDNIWEQVKCL